MNVRRSTRRWEAHAAAHRNAGSPASSCRHALEGGEEVRIRPGYLVGCQVNIGGATGEGGAGIASADEGVAFDGAEVGGSLTLGPGQAQAYYLVDAEGR